MPEPVNVRKWGRRLVIVAVVVLLGVGLRWTVLAPSRVPVDVIRVARGSVEETVTNSQAGTVRARRRAELSPDNGGRVVALPFKEGEPVRRGDVVLRLDDRVQRAELDLARKELQSAHAQREQSCLSAQLAAREERRVSRLAEEEIVSSDLQDKAATEAERAAAQCEAARANVERAEAAVHLARERLDKMVLRAPFDGVVAEIDTEVGEWVTPSPPGLPIPPIVDILDPRSVFISAPMDEVDSARVRPGQQARVTVDSHSDRHFTGRVSRVAPYVLDVEAQNRTVEIEVELEGEVAESFLPGTSADVEVILETRNDVLRIPTPALYQERQVLVVEDGRLLARDIEVGLRNWDFTEIARGLEEGDPVVTSLDRPEVEPGAPAVIEGSADAS